MTRDNYSIDDIAEPIFSPEEVVHHRHIISKKDEGRYRRNTKDRWDDEREYIEQRKIQKYR